MVRNSNNLSSDWTLNLFGERETMWHPETDGVRDVSRIVFYWGLVVLPSVLSPTNSKSLFSLGWGGLTKNILIPLYKYSRKKTNDPYLLYSMYRLKHPPSSQQQAALMNKRVSSSRRKHLRAVVIVTVGIIILGSFINNSLPSRFFWGGGAMHRAPSAFRQQ